MEELQLLIGVAIVTLAVGLHLYRRKQAQRQPAPTAPRWRPALVARPPVVARHPTATRPQHAVIVHLSLSAPAFGTEGDLDEVHALEDALAEAVSVAGVGELDGHEIGCGTCELFLYGENADDLSRLIAPIVRASRLGGGAWALHRYGSPDDPNVLTKRIDLAEGPGPPS